MKEKSYRISNVKITFGAVISLVFLFGLSLVFLKGTSLQPLLAWSAIMFIWLLELYVLIRYLDGLKNYVILSPSVIVFKQFGNATEIGWNEIKSSGSQLIIAKRLGVYEATPYLSIILNESARQKISAIKSSKEFGLVQKKENLANYMGNQKPDLAISIKFAKDEGILNLIKQQPSYTAMDPLIKTSERSEYNKMVESFGK